MYCCAACGVYKFNALYRQWLEGHELYDVDYAAGTMTYMETVPLCHYCHNYIHDGRMLALVEKGEMSQAKYAAVIQHGDRVLTENGLVRLTRKERELMLARLHIEGKMAPWKSWRMIVGGKKYGPKFKTPEHWKKGSGQW
jgi:hypothetical protein